MTVDLQQEQIERQFDRAAATYDSVASLQRQMADRLLADLPSQLEGHCVDLGCGTGALLQKLAKRIDVRKLTGVDLSSAMLNQARQRVPQAQFVKGDLASIPLDDDSFSWATSNAAIQWCDSRIVFSELQRILRPDGQAFISTFGPGTMQQWRDALEHIGTVKPRVHTFKNIQQLTDEMKDAGFRSVSSRSETIDVYFDSVREMFSSVRKLGATNARADRAKGLAGRRWLDQITDAFEKQRNPNGKLCLTYECCYLVAR